MDESVSSFASWAAVTALGLGLIGCGTQWHSDVRSTTAPLAWKNSGGGCTGRDCCIAGDPDGVCVLPETVSVPTPDGKSLAEVRYVTDQHAKLWGLADAKGTIIVPPRYDHVIALSSQALLTQDGRLIKGAAAPVNLGGRVVSMPLEEGGLLHFVVVGQQPDMRFDVAAVRPSGVLGSRVAGVIAPSYTQVGYSVGPFVAITTGPSAKEPLASLLFDAVGTVVWAGGEVRAHGAGRTLEATGEDISKPDRAVASLRVGPSPLALSKEDSGMYVPIDRTTMQPWVLPPGAIGVVPFGLHAPSDLVRKDVLDPTSVTGWVLVSGKKGAYEYRIGGGTDLDAMQTFAPENLAKMAVLDKVTVASGGGNPAQSFVVGHRKGKADWVGYVGRYRASSEWCGTRTALTDAPTEPSGATPEDAAFAQRGRVAFERQELAAKQRADEKARSERLAAEIEKRAQELKRALAARDAWARATVNPANIDKCRRVLNAECSELVRAAIIVGEPAASEVYDVVVKSGHLDWDVRAQYRKACDETVRVSMATCGIIAGGDAEAAAALATQEDARRRWEARTRSVTPAEPTVTVQYMQAGRLQTKVLTLERYNQLYGR